MCGLKKYINTCFKRITFWTTVGFIGIILISLLFCFLTSKKVSPSPTPTPTREKRFQEALVTKVIDGDTIEIEGGEKVRYIGIDTPKIQTSTEDGEYYGQEAKNKNTEFVLNKKVQLEKDVSETDRYGRLLRYIWIEDMLLNEYLVREGYARVNPYPPDLKYQEKFAEAEKIAKEEKRGIWKEEEKSSCKYSCSGPDKDCSDFATHEEALEFWNCCDFTKDNDPMNLDSTGIGDGNPCEGLP